MRFKFIPPISILLIFFIGFAGAVTIPAPTYNWGAYSGLKNPGTIQAADLEATDDCKIGDDFQVVDDTALGGDLAVTGAVTLKGSTSIDAGKTFTVGETEHRTNTSATNITITDTDPDFWFCGNSTEPGNQTYTLPTASANTGRIITFIVTTNPGANYVRVDGEGAETVDGTAIQATTDTIGTLLAVICDGTKWYELNSIGTWGGHA